MIDFGDLRPILISVTRGRWEAVPMTTPPTSRDRMLIKEIKSAGGISNTVPPGLYHFNIIPGPTGDVVSLTPLR